MMLSTLVLFVALLLATTIYYAFCYLRERRHALDMAQRMGDARDAEQGLRKVLDSTQKELAAARREHAAEREVLVREAEKHQEELERFAYTVSHDLKAPLVTVLGFLGFLEKDLGSNASERAKSDIQRIREASQKMRQLLEEILELSRIGRLMNDPLRVGLTDLAREAAEALAEPIAERGVEVTVEDGMPTVTGDRARLLELVQNLLANAVRFMGDQENPRIEIGSAFSENGPPTCFVRDNGIGIDPAQHEQVFGLFKRLNPSGEGTGIGLALVRRIAEVHGGRAWVESDGKGHGSTFYFTVESDGATLSETIGRQAAKKA